MDMAYDFRSLGWSLRTSDGGLFGTSGIKHVRYKGEFDLSERLKTIELTLDEKEKSEIKLGLENHDLSYFDNALLMKGDEFSISFGYRVDLSELITARVMNIKGFETLTVECEVIESEFDSVEKTRTFKNVTRGQIADYLAKENGFRKVIIDRTNEIGTYYQDGISDRAFLYNIGIEIGLILSTRVESGMLTLHFHRRDLGVRPTRQYVWRGGYGLMKSFEITENSILGMAQEVEWLGYDPLEKKVVSGEASSQNTNKQSNLGGASSEINHTFAIGGETGRFGRVGNPGAAKFPTAKKRVVTPYTSSDECSTGADSDYQNTQEEQIKAKATVIGHPGIQISPQGIINISGLPKMLAGNYYVVGVKHKWSESGYVTEMDLRKDAVGLRPTDQSGMISAPGVPNTKTADDPDKLVPLTLTSGETGRTSVIYRKIYDPIFKQNPKLSPAQKTQTPLQKRQFLSEAWGK